MNPFWNRIADPDVACAAPSGAPRRLAVAAYAPWNWLDTGIAGVVAVGATVGVAVAGMAVAVGAVVAVGGTGVFVAVGWATAIVVPAGFGGGAGVFVGRAGTCAG